MNRHTAPGAALLSVLLATIATEADAEVFATGLTGPIKLDVTGLGSLVVSERGTATNDGRLSIVDRAGNVRPLLSGLPSAKEVTDVPSGPTSVVVRGCCIIDLAIGEGDTLRFDLAGPPGSQVPNPVGASSPIFSSVMRIVLSAPVDQITAGFELPQVKYDNIADGYTVALVNTSGEKAWVRLLEELKDFRPDPMTNVRGSNPFGMTSGPAETLLIADGGQNSLVQVSVGAAPRTLVRFPPVPNPEGVLPPVTDAVPTSVRHLRGDQYLVSLFAGVPFAPGTSSIRLVDIEQRKQSVLIAGLTSVTDTLPIGSSLYVLEMSANLSQGAPGQLLRYSSPSSTPTVVASGLIGPTGMVYSPRDRAIYITELFAGQITRVPL
jgi:hypothetical protein